MTKLLYFWISIEWLFDENAFPGNLLPGRIACKYMVLKIIKRCQSFYRQSSNYTKTR